MMEKITMFETTVGNGKSNMFETTGSNERWQIDHFLISDFIFVCRSTWLFSEVFMNVLWLTTSKRVLTAIPQFSCTPQLHQGTKHHIGFQFHACDLESRGYVCSTSRYLGESPVTKLKFGWSRWLCSISSQTNAFCCRLNIVSYIRKIHMNEDRCQPWRMVKNTRESTEMQDWWPGLSISFISRSYYATVSLVVSGFVVVSCFFQHTTQQTQTSSILNQLSNQLYPAKWPVLEKKLKKLVNSLAPWAPSSLLQLRIWLSWDK